MRLVPAGQHGLCEGGLKLGSEPSDPHPATAITVIRGLMHAHDAVVGFACDKDVVLDAKFVAANIYFTLLTKILLNNNYEINT